MQITSTDPQIRDAIGRKGFAMIPGSTFQFRELDEAWKSLATDWQHLEVDQYMSDSGQYRLRRFGRFFYLPVSSDLRRLPHATVFQSSYVNSFAGGIHRNFAPLRDSTFINAFLQALIRFDFQQFEVTPKDQSKPWEVWVHQIRIETSGQTVPPAPEGIHHDGHDFIAMHLIQRDNVEGGGSHLYDNSKVELFAHVMVNPLDSIYADDHRVMHSVEPIRPLHGGRHARRDILIIDFDLRPALQLP